MHGRGASAAGGGASVARAETADVLIRNHDLQWGYDLELRARRPDGTIAADRGYYLQPGGTRREVSVLDPGEYTVAVVLDGDREADRTCRVGDGPTEGVLVELGNGAVSVHDGLDG